MYISLTIYHKNGTIYIPELKGYRFFKKHI